MTELWTPLLITCCRQVHTKLQSVLRRKDARLAAAQAALAAAEARAAQTEALIERQRALLLAAAGSSEDGGR